MPIRTLYSGIIFLSQITLVPGDHKAAAELVEGYVNLFEKAVSQKDLGSKLLSALLTGINKAFPFLQNIDALSKHTDELFRIVHGASFASSTQALTLISHIALSDDVPVPVPEKGEKGDKGEEGEEESDGEGEEEEEKGEEIEEESAAASTKKEPELVTRFYR